MLVPTSLNHLTASDVVLHRHPSQVVDRSASTSTATKRQYKCTTCPKSFTRPSALKTHVYTHTGEKPFECTTPGCGRRFAVISNLRRHFKVHARVQYELASSSLHYSDMSEYLHHHHHQQQQQQRIPASERLRHVQRLMERTASLQLVMTSSNTKHLTTTEECGGLSDSCSTTSSCSSSTSSSPPAPSIGSSPYFMSSSRSATPTLIVEQNEYCWDQHRLLTHRSS